MSDNPVFDRIQQEINENEVVLYMKGTPIFPQCGFSATLVQVLSELEVKFKGIDVLMDPTLRDGIKQFSDWPTVPQLYVKGEFVGGCDVVEVRERSKQLGICLEAAELAERDIPDYIEVDHAKMKGTFVRVPKLADVPYPVTMEPNLVVEYYSSH